MIRTSLHQILTLTAGLVLAAPTLARAAEQPAPHFGPTAQECAQAEQAVANDRATAGLVSQVGVSTWIGPDTCLVTVDFASADNLLAFVDARLAAGEHPTTEPISAYGVNLLLEVQGDNTPVVQTEKQAEALQAQLGSYLTDWHLFAGDHGANGYGLTKAKGVWALDVMFVKDQDVRDYVAAAIAHNVYPAPFYGSVGGKTLVTPALMEVVGVISAQPAVTVSN